MKNDIKTKSTDFLPQKPGLSSTTATSAPATDAPAAAPAVNDLPPGAPTPSKHVIDLKSSANATTPTTNQDSKDFMVKNNPFLQGKKSPEDLKVEPAPVAATSDSPAADAKLPEAPKPTTDTTEAANAADDTKKIEPGTSPDMDLAHPESDQANAPKDSLKDAMVSDEANTQKPKKKMPTWLMVLIIVVAVILIGVITFAVLNAVAKPTGL